MTRPVRLLVAQIASFWRRLARSWAMSRALARIGTPVLKQAGLIEERSKAGALEWAYRGYVIIGFGGVILIPTYREETLIYFPAILALSGAWLLTMPLYAANLTRTTFSRLRPPKGSWRILTEALELENLVLPPEAKGEEAEAAMDTLLPDAVPAVAPMAIWKMLRLLALRAAFIGVVGIVGILAGPALASVRIWHGWSPVSILFGVSAPLAGLLLISLLLPFVLQSFLSGLEFDAAMNDVSEAVAKSGIAEPRQPRSNKAPRSHTNGTEKSRERL